jgi:pyruvate kinase
MNHKTKIIATLGPGCQEVELLRQMLKAGVDVARLNFSFGSYEYHQERISTVRQLSKEVNKTVAILQDLQGPKLRVGDLPKGEIHLTSGQIIQLSTGRSSLVDVDIAYIPLDVPNFEKSVQVGKRILLDDGQLEFEVTEVNKKYIKAIVILGGVLRSHKGVNLPGTHLDIPGFTEKDYQDLQFGLRCGIDAVAISYVRCSRDIEAVRDTIVKIDPSKKGIPIFAKIELPEAVDNLQEILEVSDGVMVARGDLAIETSLASVPIIQKVIIQAANQTGKYVITATQMLDSMIMNPRPTRAETTDVANAIFDGTDAVMLSGETASGKYPLESVVMMAAIICEAEDHSSKWGHCQPNLNEPTLDDAISITRAARELAQDRNVAAIAVFTQTGRTALLMSKSRPQVPILAFTPNEQTFQRLGMYWGVKPFIVSFASTVESMVKIVDEAMVSISQVCKGQQVVIISGLPLGSMQKPNFALLHTIGDPV